MFNQDPNRPDRPDRYQSPEAPQRSPWGTPVPSAGTPNTLAAGVRTGVVPREGFLTLSFIWMFLALLVSAGAAYVVMNNVAVIEKVSGAFIFLIIIELVLVVAITGLVNRIGAIPALGLLFVYAAVNGLVLGVIVYALRGHDRRPGRGVGLRRLVRHLRRRRRLWRAPPSAT